MLLVACAMGGSQAQQQQPDAAKGSNVVQDAPKVSTLDAKLFEDAASHPLDAFVPKDAALQGEGGVCTDNTNCAATLCCFVAFCVQGTPIGTTICIPSN